MTEASGITLSLFAVGMSGRFQNLRVWQSELSHSFQEVQDTQTFAMKSVNLHPIVVKYPAAR